MNTRNLRIELSAAEQGMVLAADILDGNEQTVLSAGVTLSESIIKSMQLRGIRQIAVVDENMSDADLVAQVLLSGQRICMLFRNSDKTGAIEELRNSIVLYRREQLA